MSPVAGVEFWVIARDNLIAMLRRANDGENPELLYLELVANSSPEHVDGID